MVEVIFFHVIWIYVKPDEDEKNLQRNTVQHVNVQEPYLREFRDINKRILLKYKPSVTVP
jgi:hypothetical protein